MIRRSDDPVLRPTNSSPLEPTIAQKFRNLKNRIGRPDERRMLMRQDDKVSRATQPGADHRESAVIITRDTGTVAFFVALAAGNDAEFERRCPALFEEIILLRKQLFDRLFPVERAKPAVLIKVFGHLTTMVGRRNHHEASGIRHRMMHQQIAQNDRSLAEPDKMNFRPRPQCRNKGIQRLRMRFNRPAAAGVAPVMTDDTSPPVRRAGSDLSFRLPRGRSVLRLFSRFYYGEDKVKARLPICHH